MDNCEEAVYCSRCFTPGKFYAVKKDPVIFKDNMMLQQAVDAVAAAKGNKTKAAELIGIPRNTLLLRLALANSRGLYYDNTN